MTTAQAEPSDAPAKSRAGLFWVGLVALVLVLAVLGGSDQATDDVPLDPASTGDAGSRALVLLLEELGARVEVSDEVVATSDVVLVLRDDLTDAQRDRVEAHARAGARIVVADPASPLVDAPTEALAGSDPFAPVASVLPREVCTIDALDGVGAIATAGGRRIRTVEEGRQCFGPGGAGFVTTRPLGEGLVVAVGSTAPFQNSWIDQEDNSVLVAGLLAPESGSRVTWLEGRRSSDSLWALVGPGARAALAQLGVAVALYVFWRARRLGRPVQEPQPVQLAGSELVGAVGRLLRQSGDPDRAARLLRDDLRRSLRERLGLPRGASPEVIASATEARAGVDAAVVYRAVADRPVTTDEELVALATEVERVRRGVCTGAHLGSPRASPSTSTPGGM